MLIIGCGDVGRKLAIRSRAAGMTVRCLVRSAASAAQLDQSGLDALASDLDRQPPEPGFLQGHDRIHYLAPTPTSGTTDPRMQRFLAALPPTGRHRLVYISTTGVYGDCGGEWVDEGRQANPQVDRARRRFDAEQQLLGWRAANGGQVIILRVAGIYGPGKLPLERIEKQVPMIAERDAPWTNRIHIDDLVSVCEAAMLQGRDGEIYNVSDGSPGNMRDYFDRVADHFGLPRPPVIGLDEAQASLSPGMLSYLGESRRLDNRKMLRDLGVTLRYPDLVSGLDGCSSPRDR